MQYESPSTGLMSHAPQYIAEIIMTREAKKNCEVLPPKFWNIDKYKKRYKLLLIKINSLLKIYDERALIAAIRNNQWMYSLYYPNLPDLIEKEVVKLDKQVQLNETQIVEFVESTDSFRQISTNNRNMKSRLDE